MASPGVIPWSVAGSAAAPERGKEPAEKHDYCAGTGFDQRRYDASVEPMLVDISPDQVGKRSGDQQSGHEQAPAESFALWRSQSCGRCPASHGYREERAADSDRPTDRRSSETREPRRPGTPD